jgi:hypothetical protein
VSVGRGVADVVGLGAVELGPDAVALEPPAVAVGAGEAG